MIKKNILIAEDESLIASIIKEIAEDEGFNVSIVSTGNEAFTLIAANRELYDCVILDLKLPGMNGEEVVKHLDTLGSDTKIVIYSGLLDSDIYARLNRFDMVISCHQKPTNISIFRSIFRTITENGIEK